MLKGLNRDKFVLLSKLWPRPDSWVTPSGGAKEEIDRFRREKNLGFRLEVDGGVDLATGPKCRAAGADTFVAGTEGAIAACVWSLFLGIVWFRSLNWKMLIKVSMDTIETTAIVLLIVAAASIFGWMLTVTRTTEMIATTRKATSMRRQRSYGTSRTTQAAINASTT